MTANRHPQSPHPALVLGLDIGAASIGWALIETDNRRPVELRASGARAFAAGVEGDISSGRDSSRAAARREARLRRRQLARRRHRLTKLARILQRAALLPPGDLESGPDLMGYFADLDQQLFTPEARQSDPHLLPYRLRARGLDEKLEPYEIGRALYHLAHRRGFLSTRRVKPKPPGEKETEEEKAEGPVKSDIRDLAHSIRESGARTLGEYLSKLDPEAKRVRGQYLGRQMLIDEFEAIWTAQAAHHPDRLTDDLKQQVRRAIFFQRPLKSQRGLIGDCDLEKGRRRAPLACLAAQRFRMLQKVNDLEVSLPDGQRRKLTDDERAKLVNALEREGDRTFPQTRALLDLPKRGCRFNFETEGEKGLIGNRTARRLADVFGRDRWDSFTAEESERVVHELRSIHNRAALKRRAMKLWDLDEPTAARLSEVALEDGYSNLSRNALAKVLPLMQEGVSYATARKEVYGEQRGPRALRFLPAVHTVLDVRNPAVERALTELRKIINAVVRDYGKPDRIRIELARDLRRPRKSRQAISKRNAKNRRDRDSAREILREEFAMTAPSRRDVDKFLLWEECGRHCPYTGRPISYESLFGDNPQFDIEHIIPFHRSLDNSFINKTLCDITENRTTKGNQTPWEAYGHDPERWSQIIGRVKQFTGHSARAKLERFQTEDLGAIDDFASSQLNDTRYASRLAVSYLGMLYGADAKGVDPADKKRVEASRGAVTAFLRDEWHLNYILGGGEKVRDDHRQHAIDAIVTALTTPGQIKRLSDAAARAANAGRRRFAPVAPPWPGFLDDVNAAIAGMIVSHRVSRKVTGALHEQTHYSKPQQDEEGNPCVHIRKPLHDISAKDIPSIVDPAVREAVRARLTELGETDPKKAFKDRTNHPSLRAADGREIPIHKVRIRVPVGTHQIGPDQASARHVKLGDNHHVEVVETTDKRGRKCWKGCVVTRLEALRRIRAGEPVINRDHGPGSEFQFSLARGEIIELNTEEDKRELFVVRKVTKRVKGRRERVTVGIVPINDARASTGGTQGDARQLEEPSAEVLRMRGCRKVVVTPLGEVRTARD